MSDNKGKPTESAPPVQATESNPNERKGHSPGSDPGKPGGKDPWDGHSTPPKKDKK